MQSSAGQPRAGGIRRATVRLCVRVRVTDVSEAQASGACGLPRGFGPHGPVDARPRCRARAPSAACTPVTVAGFRVYPPEHTTSGVAPMPFKTCPTPAYGDMLGRAINGSE